jgi:hypothetical protein
VTQAQSFDDARCNRYDVFQRSTDFNTDDVVAAVETKCRPTKLRLNERGGDRVGRRREHRRRQPLRHFDREAGPGEHDHRMLPISFLRNHFRHQERVGFKPSGGADETAFAAARVQPA